MGWYFTLKNLAKKSCEIHCPNSHSKPIFRSLSILTIDDLFNMQCCKLYLKSLKHTLPVYFREQFRKVNDTHNYPTRQQDNLRPPTISCNLQNQLISVKVAKVWNHLPHSLKPYSVNSIHNFCNRYHDHLVKQYSNNGEHRNCYICQL